LIGLPCGQDRESSLWMRCLTLSSPPVLRQLISRVVLQPQPVSLCDFSTTTASFDLLEFKLGDDWRMIRLWKHLVCDKGGGLIMEQLIVNFSSPIEC
jgi:hypothetical protein